MMWRSYRMEKYDTEVEQLFLYSVIYPTFIYLCHCASFCMKIIIKQSIDRSELKVRSSLVPQMFRG